MLFRSGFSLIPPDGLGMVASANPRLVLPSRSVLAYVTKQGRSSLLEWNEGAEGWNWLAGDYPPGWDKKVKVLNPPTLAKGGSVKLKSAKKKDEAMSSESDLPPMGHLALLGSPPSRARAVPATRSTAGKSKQTTSQPSAGAPPSSRTRGSKRKTSPPPARATERRVCYL